MWRVNLVMYRRVLCGVVCGVWWWSVLENINYVCIENPPFNYGKMQTRIKYEDDLCVRVAASPRREQ